MYVAALSVINEILQNIIMKYRGQTTLVMILVTAVPAALNVQFISL